jgi:SAM-dependent methyltransferase
MLATELDAARLELLRRAVTGAGADVAVQAGVATSSALPDSCCDVIVMRTVYHHVGDPAAMNASLHRALKPRGRLVIIEFAPVGPLRWAHVEGAAEQRRGHGVSRAELDRELASAGFRPVKELANWHPLMYAIVFERLDGPTRAAPAP